MYSDKREELLQIIRWDSHDCVASRVTATGSGLQKTLEIYIVAEKEKVRTWTCRQSVYRLIEQAAKLDGLPVSTWMRRVLRSAARRRISREKRADTGESTDADASPEPFAGSGSV